MKYTDCGFQTRISEVEIKARQIYRHHQPFVTENIGAKTCHMKAIVGLKPDLGFTPPHKKTGIKFLVIDNSTGTDKYLLKNRQRLQGNRP